MPARRLWTDTLVNQSIASGGSASAELTSTFLTNEMRLAQMTLVRTIVGIDIGYSVHDAGEGSQLGSCGIAVVGRDALTAGIGSLPDPSVATDKPLRPWVWRYRARVYGFAADQPAVYSRRVDLDLRAQRKLENGELVFIMANDPQEGVASTILYSGLIRCLFLVS